MSNTLPFKNNNRGGQDLSSKEMFSRLNYEQKQNDYNFRNKQKNDAHNFKQQIRAYIFKFAAYTTPLLMVLWIVSVGFNLLELRTAIEVLGNDVLLLIFGALLGKIL